MSVINRIELASLLNKHGDVSSPWEAKMRHLVLNLRGQSTAMNMENGFGKTTLSDALIGLLSRDRTLIQKTKRKMSPSKDGHPWSHIRVEFSYTSGTDSQSDMLSMAGDNVGGEQWVFGMYGHSDTDGGYYFFPGRLEELPVHSTTADGKLQLFSNEHIQQQLRQLKPERPKDKETWLDAMSLHISRKELEQLASFQKEGGADKSQIFNAIKPRPGEKADQAFFYEVLAPQILAGASHGETDESEEFIEELVINSGRKVSELRHQIQENSKDLDRNESKKSRLEDLNKSAVSLGTAQQERDQCREQLSDQAGCMAVLSRKGIPGVPTAAEDEEKESALAQEMAIRVGETAPLVPLSALADITGASARKIEIYFESRQLAGFRHDKTPIVYYPQANWNSGKTMRFYPASKASALLSESQDLFRDDSHRVNTLELLDDAADRFFDLDSNPFRENYLADQSFKETLQNELKALKDHKLQLQRDLEILQNRDNEFTDNETVYTDALKEGLFTEQELDQPDDTEKSVIQLKNAIAQEYDKFLQDEGRFSALVDKWTQFQRNYGVDTAPVDILQEKELRIDELSSQQALYKEQEEKLQSKETQVSQQLQAVERQLPLLQKDSDHLSSLKTSYDQITRLYPEEAIEGLAQRLENRQSELRNQTQSISSQKRDQQLLLGSLQTLLADYQAFRRVFPDQPPEGLEDNLREQESSLVSTLLQQEKLVSELELLLSDLTQFRQEFPDIDPGKWLVMAAERYPQSLTEREKTKTAIADIERQLSDLETDPVSPGAVEMQCVELLKSSGLEPQALHQVISELMPEDDSRKLQWLSQTHNLLFAPVLATEHDAQHAAREFARQRLPVPVFTREALQQAVDNPQASLLGAATGHESLAVKSLLDPSFITELKAQLQVELSQHQQTLLALQEAIALYAPDSDETVIARSAAQAISRSAETELPIQQVKLAEQQLALHTIKEQLSPENRKLIRSAEQFEQKGGEAAIVECELLLEQYREQLDKLSTELSKLDEQLSADARRTLNWAEDFLQQGGDARLNQVTEELQQLSIQQEQFSEHYEGCRAELEQCRQQLQLCLNQISDVFQPNEKDLLETLSDYLEKGGPEFMANAPARKADLGNQKHRADQRASLKFDRIRAYLSARDNLQGTADLKKQIAAFKQQLKDIEADQEGKQEEVEGINKALPQQLNAIRQVDETAHRWLNQLAWFKPEMLEELGDQDPEKLEAMPLFEKAEHYISIHNGEMETILASAEVLAEQLEQENTQELHRELKRREKAHDEKQELFRSALTRIRESERHLFNGTELTRLNSLDKADSQALTDLESMIATIGEQLDKSRERQNLLEASMEGNEQNLQERLSSIILYSVDNLRILKKVAKQSSGDNAYFVIDADIVSEDGVRNLVRSLLAEIEEHQKQIRRRKAQNLPVGSEEKQSKELQKNLRSQIYRQLFTNIRIRLKHEAIRPHGNLFSMNEDMSEGQREALSLMWLVKLSEFAIEREIRTVPSQYRRKERKSGESVIILDGLFSKLSHRRLIEDSLESLRNTRGRFQMIGLIHNPNYENDASIFPTYLVGNVIGGLQGQGGHVMVKEGVKVSPTSVGRGKGEASLFHIHVENEATS
ncbi:hypothetical protein [Endozoicomonas ascidiicola]|uniref:hypothetical protein n=1 Tax=Endozoicomonas ascidiicola TaxID=1698521 RepID=UPI000831DB99|nr:hypothetical protein [Endozoicomonas ascidiicola]